MQFLDKAFMTAMVLTETMPAAYNPEYYFPTIMQQEIWTSPSVLTIIALCILSGILLISIIGYAVGKSSIGDKQRLSKLVVTVDEDNPHKVSTESRKNRCALFFYSFSFSRNFQEIFTKAPKTIRDSKFEVFNGLRVHMLAWIVLGHTYLLGDACGTSTEILRY